MKQNSIKIKQFIKKHDELFFILIFLIMISGYALNVETTVVDEGWDFQNVYKLYNGYKIYIDANIITTPLFHIINLGIFKIFGANFFVFRISNIVTCLLLFLGIYKILKKIINNKKISLLFTLLIFMFEKNSILLINSYNTLAMVFVIYGILIILNKNNIKCHNIYEAIMITLIILTKQNIGFFYIIGYFLYSILSKEKIKNIAKTYGIVGIFLIIFLIILYKYGVLNGFISFCVLGIKEFAQENKCVGNYFWFMSALTLINAELILYINTTKKNNIKSEQKYNINVLACFAYPMLLMTYPLFNYAHINYAILLQYVIILFGIYIIMQNKNINNKILNILILGIIAVYSYISIGDVKSYFNEILNDVYTYDNIYFGTLFDTETKEKIEIIDNYIENSEKRVIVLSSDAAIYVMPLKQSNGMMDLPLLGNLGKDGYKGLEEELNSLENVIILINKEKAFWQESDEVIDYVKNNFEYVGEIEDMLIYEK